MGNLLDHCSKVYVHDLDICSDVKNGDGIDLRSGCNHCVVENITGSTSDDTVACTALGRGKSGEPYPHNSKYLWPGEMYIHSHENIDGDIHHISVRNITSNISKHAVQIAADIDKVSIDNITQNNPNRDLIYCGYI